MPEIADIEAQVAKQKPAALYVLVGGDPITVDRAIDAIRKKVVPNPISGINDEVLHGRSVVAQQLIANARTIPMLSDRRMILVRNADDIPSAEQEGLAGYIAKPDDTSCVVFVLEKMDARSKLGKAAKAAKCVFEAAELKPHQVANFVRAECARRSLAIEDAASHALADALGTDISLLADALERLSLFGDGKTINARMVEETVAHHRIDSIWLLVDAISQKKKKVALQATLSLLSDREPPLKILAMVHRQFKMLGKMHHALLEGASADAAAKMAGVPPFKSGEMASAAKRFKTKELQQAFALLLDADLALKGSKTLPEHVLQDVVLRLCA